MNEPTPDSSEKQFYPKGSDAGLAPLIKPGTSDSDLKVYAFPGGGSLTFQNGAMELGRNGATTEEVLDALIEHINFFQRGKYACRENALIITKLEEAKHWALHRKQLREPQNVKGREAAHV
jgi:hypothetical protein